MSLLVDLFYTCTLLPHYYWHKLVTGKYGAKVQEKTGKIPVRSYERLPFSNKVLAESCRLAESYIKPITPDKVKCLWLHAVSVGEVIAAKNLIYEFMATNPNWDFIISTTTETGRKVAIDSFGVERVVYFPLDISWMVKKAFLRIRPNLIVLMEQEIWPNFLDLAKKKNVPVIVANARVTSRAAKRLKKFHFFTAKMLNNVNYWFPQNEEYADRLRWLGVDESKIKVLGSVKYDAIPENIDESIAIRYRNTFLPERKIKNLKNPDLLLIAGSTHPTEEKIILDAWSKIKTQKKLNIYLVLVPRHPERLEEVELLAKSYAPTVRRSMIVGKKDNTNNYEIIIGDTMGELNLFYYAADVVFIGGSIYPHGGQNFLEPCGIGKATVVGSNLWNFSEPAEFLQKAQALSIIHKPEELLPCLEKLLTDRDYRISIGEKARDVLLSYKGATKKTVLEINSLINTYNL